MPFVCILMNNSQPWTFGADPIPANAKIAREHTVRVVFRLEGPHPGKIIPPDLFRRLAGAHTGTEDPVAPWSSVYFGVSGICASGLLLYPVIGLLVVFCTIVTVNMSAIVFMRHGSWTCTFMFMSSGG